MTLPTRFIARTARSTVLRIASPDLTCSTRCAERRSELASTYHEGYTEPASAPITCSTHRLRDAKLLAGGWLPRADAGGSCDDRHKIIFCCAARSPCDQCCDTDCQCEGVPIGGRLTPGLDHGCYVRCAAISAGLNARLPTALSALITTNPHYGARLPGCDGDHKKHVCPSWRRTSRVVASTNAHVAPMVGPLSTNRRL